METLLAILSDIRPDINFREQQNLMDSGILDSLDIVTIVAAIEEQMDLVIPYEELTPETFNSAHSLFSMIERLR